MSNLIETIREQIKSSKGLLTLFQDERSKYQNKAQIGVKEVMDILKRKKRLVETFEQQHNIVKQTIETEDGSSETDKKEKRSLIRDLSEILEQLLVIDHENEKLLRNLMSSRETSGMGGMAGRNVASQQERPALQRRLPFVPGMRQVFSSTPMMSKPTPAPAALPKPAQALNSAMKSEKKEESIISTIQNNMRLRPKSKLKNYAQAAQLLQLTSKYA